MSVDFKTPPALDDEISYDRWKLKVEHWQFCTKLEKNKQASAILLSLKDKNAVDACLEVEIEKLQADDEVEVLLEKLDTL